MSDLTYNQLLKTIAPDGNYDRLTPKPRRLLPALAVGFAVLMLPSSAYGAWVAVQPGDLGQTVSRTLPDGMSLRQLVTKTCFEEFGPVFDGPASIDATEVYRNGQEISTIYNPPEPGDDVEIRCRTLTLEMANNRNPLSQVMRLILPEETFR